ncbi:MAG: ISL3 family transposase [Chloroflexi bacterium]|nr:ISL3 family transposase [Chloroflexota bacterium]
MSPTLLPAPDRLHLDFLSASGDVITLAVTTTAAEARCPLCDRPSTRVHSIYRRLAADLPWGDVAVQLRLTTRRFFCPTEGCERKVFTERLPDLIAPYARRTLRLTEALELIGFALGGEAGARTLSGLSMSASPDTLLRVVRAAALPEPETPRVLGVDDFAFRKGQTYGTILVDLERRCRVDLLPDRTAEALAAWLASHPGVEVVSRDRGGAYAQGAKEGAPEAEQVADRFHLLVNLREALERLASRKHGCLREAAEACSDRAAPVPPGPEEHPAPAGNPPTTRVEGERAARRARRLERYETVRAMREQGVSINDIARQLGLGRHTVRRFLRAEAFPERARPAPRPGLLSPYEPYLRERWEAGCQNAQLLFEEIRDRGFTGSASYVRHYLARWRSEPSKPGRKGKNATPSPPASPAIRPLSPRQASWLLVRPATSLDAEDQAHVEELCRSSPEIATAYQLAQEFRRLVGDRDAAALEGWLAAAERSGVPEAVGFAAGLRRDRRAVDAAVTLEWSNGQLEGQVNRLEVVKRQMFGRANFDLLRQRILRAA